MFESPLHVYHWHREGFELPAGAEVLAAGERFPHQAYRYGTHAFGVQFHPEMNQKILDVWLVEGAKELARARRNRRSNSAATTPATTRRWIAGAMASWTSGCEPVARWNSVAETRCSAPPKFTRRGFSHAAQNSADQYGTVTRFLHWAVFLLFVWQYLSANIMTRLGGQRLFGLNPNDYYNWHKSIGLVLLALALARWIWRKTTPLPDWAPTCRRPSGRFPTVTKRCCTVACSCCRSVGTCS